MDRPTNQNFTRFAFTPSVKNVQERYGSRKSYARMEQAADRYRLGPREAEFIEGRDSFYMATVGENGWPYVQFRGGPKGFLRVLGPTRLGFADFRGNLQYISVGNLESSRRANLFIVDYPTRQRLKIWAESTVVEASHGDELAEQLSLDDYFAVVERFVTFEVKAFDWNCPQHITPRFTHEEIRAGVEGLDPELIRSCCPDSVGGPQAT